MNSLRYFSKFLLFVVASSAYAEWDVYIHNPGPINGSRIFAVSENNQAGVFHNNTGGGNHAAILNPQTGETTILGPSSIHTWITCMDNEKQAGFFQTPSGQRRVALWRGTPDSMVDLTPPGSTFTTVNAIKGDIQVGAYNTRGSHACSWSGTVDSLVDLHPGGANSSEAFAIDEVENIYGTADGQAAIWWQGMPNGYVSLHPSWKYQESRVFAADLGYQFGFVWNYDGTPFAAGWNGTSDSFFSMAPAGTWASGITASHEGIQTGFASYFPNGSMAYLWANGVEGFLHGLLPEGRYTESYATSIYVKPDYSEIRVGGWAFGLNEGVDGILWVWRP